jgi:hypothetical protein
MGRNSGGGAGPGAAGDPAGAKYAVLARLAREGVAGGTGAARRALRLLLLLVERHHWAADRLAIGREEIARLWAADPRTVRRELAAMKAAGWLRVREAGVRGRVTVYGLGAALRGEALREPAAPAGTPDRLGADGEGAAGAWARAFRLIEAEDAAMARSWAALLEPREEPGGGLLLEAPGRFQARWIATHLSGRIGAALAEAAPGLPGFRIAPAGQPASGGR